MIERKYHRSLQLFSWVACGAMAVKLVLFTEYGTQRRRGPAALGLDEPADAREPPPHVFTGIQKYADRKLDEFFGVDDLQKQGKQMPPQASAASEDHKDE